MGAMYSKNKPPAHCASFCGRARLPKAACLILAACLMSVRHLNQLLAEQVENEYTNNAVPESRRLAPRRSRVGAHSAKQVADFCVVTKVDSYTPSSWEAAWRRAAGHLGTSDNTVCAAMQKPTNVINAEAWIAHLAFCRQADGNGTRRSVDCLSQADPAIFSRFHKSCATAGGRRVEWTEPIEPLVGHMRHPYANPQCLSEGVVGVRIEDRAYLMPLSDSPERMAAHGYNGRKYLIDAGTNMHGTGLAWLVGAYERAGITFDEIFAWEASPVNATAYWADVPPGVAHALHFMNVPIQAEAGAPMNPLTWVRSIYKPGDFVVFKLDIDNDALESALIAQIADSVDLAGMIAEMFYEKHYREPAMQGYLGFDDQAAPYAEAVTMLGDLRARGLRIHYWP